MKAFITYQIKNYIRSLLFIPPVALYMAWIIVQYSYRNVEVMSSYSNTAIVLVVIATWISMNVFRIEEKTEKHILLVQLPRREQFLYGKWITCLLFTLPLVFLAHFYPILTDSFNRPLVVTDYILSFYAHIGLAGLGVLTGSFFCGTKVKDSYYVWLLTALTVTSSFAYPLLIEALPNFISWVLWILPPLRYFYEPLKQATISGLPVGFLASFSFAVFYILIMGIIILKLFMKNED